MCTHPILHFTGCSCTLRDEQVTLCRNAMRRPRSNKQCRIVTDAEPTIFDDARHRVCNIHLAEARLASHLLAKDTKQLALSPAAAAATTTDRSTTQFPFPVFDDDDESSSGSHYYSASDDDDDDDAAEGPTREACKLGQEAPTETIAPESVQHKEGKVALEQVNPHMADESPQSESKQQTSD